MKRFMSFLVLAAGVLTLSACRQAAKPVGLALYSVQGLDSSRFAAVLDSVAAMGVSRVEVATYKYPERTVFGMQPERVRELAEERGLEVLSSNCNGPGFDIEDPDACLEAWKAVLDDHARMGCTYFAMSMHSGWGDETRVTQFCELMNRIGAAAKERGLQFLYHNHNMEFNTIEGTDTVLIDYIVAHTDPALVGLQCDVYWAMQGGADPVAFIERYADRIKVLHIKDYYILGESGKLDFPAIFQAFYSRGKRDFFIEMEPPCPIEASDLRARVMFSMAKHSPSRLSEDSMEAAQELRNYPSKPIGLEQSLANIRASVRFLQEGGLVD